MTEITSLVHLMSKSTHLAFHGSRKIVKLNAQSCNIDQCCALDCVFDVIIRNSFVFVAAIENLSGCNVLSKWAQVCEAEAYK